MRRRHFLQAAACAAVPLFGRRLTAGDLPVAVHPLVVTVGAEGAWDPTGFCDPRGAPVNRAFTDSQIVQIGNFALAPVSRACLAFFAAHHERLLVINGIQVATNNHEVGKRYTFSGSMAVDFPCLGALCAAAFGPQLGLSFITGGGYDSTHNEVALTRVSQGTLAALRESPGGIDAAVWRIITEGAAQRLERRLAGTSMPVVRQRMELLQLARRNPCDFAAVACTVDDIAAHVVAPTNNPLVLQVQLGMAGYKNGLTVALHLNVGSFDSHGDHDATHYDKLDTLFAGVHYLMRVAAYLELDQNIFLYMASDFGRTPYYNEGAGKDHWPVSSSILLAPGLPGNRIVGGTDGELGARKVCAHRPALFDDAGEVIQPEQMHHMLRHRAGLDTHAVHRRYPLAGQRLAWAD